MTILNMSKLQFSTCPDFWKDIKFLYKHTKKKELKPIFEDETFSDLDDESKIDCIPYIKSIKYYILNSYPNLDGISDIYQKQPFLAKGWQIRKLRYAIDNRGKSHGIRLIFCINQEFVIFTYINLKNYCTNERELEATFMQRLVNYLTP